jgi:hypothetical protein
MKVAEPPRWPGTSPTAVPHRLGPGHGHASGQTDGADHPCPWRWWGGPLRPRLRRLLAGSSPHEQPWRADDHHPPSRAQAAGGQSPGSGIRPSGLTTAPAGRAWNTSSRVCCAASTAADEPGCDAGYESAGLALLAAAVNLARFAALGSITGPAAGGVAPVKHPARRLSTTHPATGVRHDRRPHRSAVMSSCRSKPPYGSSDL